MGKAVEKKIEAGTKVLAIWGRPADPYQDPEVLRHAGNGVWVMWSEKTFRGSITRKTRYPRHALEVAQ